MVFAASTFTLIKFGYWNVGSANSAIYWFDIKTMHLNFPYYGGCLCDMTAYYSTSASYFGMIAYNFNTDAVMIETYYDGANLIKCLGSYIDGTTAAMNILFSATSSSGVTTTYLGYIASTFPASPYTMSMTVTPLNTAGYNFIGSEGKFTSLNNYYIAGYILISTYYQGFLYTTISAKACSTFPNGAVYS